jgi:hypothetical protein
MQLAADKMIRTIIRVHAITSFLRPACKDLAAGQALRAGGNKEASLSNNQGGFRFVLASYSLANIKGVHPVPGFPPQLAAELYRSVPHLVCETSHSG